MILDRSVIEAQAYLDCQNILMALGKKKNKQRFEAACQEIIKQHGYPTYTTFKRVLATINGDQQQPQPLIPAASDKESTLVNEALPDILVRKASCHQDRG